MDRQIGQVLHERYCIQSLLGRRTGRRTFLASDLQLGLPVVVKLLLFSPDFTWEDLKLFEREAEVLKSLDHPAIPKLLDYFEVETELGKGFALVQTYIAAQSLQSQIQAGRTFSEKELKAIAKSLLEILNYIHNRQPPVVHRDIKPSNILLGDNSSHSPGQLYLIDFGSVQTAAHGGTVTIVGTYGYMPPEQFGGRAVPASDLYSVGATLIYLATGQHPSDLPQRELRIEFKQFTSLSPSFIRWIQWLSDPNPAGRPESAEAALGADFDRYFRATKQHLSLIRPIFSSIQIEKTKRTFEIKVPPSQLQYVTKQESLVGCFIVLGIISIGWLGLLLWICLGMPSLFLLYCLFRDRRSEIESYRVVIHLEEYSISVSLVSIGSEEPKNCTILSGERLVSLSVGPNLPKYELHLIYEDSGDFYITGNRAEIQWLCDELNEWTGREIQYKDYTPTA